MDVGAFVTSDPNSSSAGVAVGPAKGLRAIVIGTGMAGLAAARIMADHFDEVSRDAIPIELPLLALQMQTATVNCMC
jgi:hypothetical protein